MNDFGMTLAWSAVQVSLVIAPAAVLHLVASRRSAASGAQVAATGLFLSVAISITTFIPLPRTRIVLPDTRMAVGLTAAPIDTNRAATTNIAKRNGASSTTEPRRHDAAAGSLSFASVMQFFKLVERQAARPAARIRRWASTLAVAGIIGAGVGLLRLLLGLWAVRLCRRRGKIQDDPQLIDLLDELRTAVGCRRTVEVREVPGLLTPATAGWLLPVILLPDDWPSWDAADRKAVLAHELAHVARWDYAIGLAARLALALNFYHPLVRWMAGRLLLQQEFAADAVGARFGGGRDSYLRTLSRMALKQDGGSPCWPARAFLPARGALIRRIAMLQNDSVVLDRPWSGPRRLLAGLCLFGLAAMVVTWRGPDWAGQKEKASRVRRVASMTLETSNTLPAPFDLQFVSDSSEAFVAFRPAATFRRPGMTGYPKLISEACLPKLAKVLLVDLTGPNYLKLGLDDIESVTVNLDFGRATNRNNRKEPEFRTLKFEWLTIRTIAPFDWQKFLRQWRFEFSAVHDGDREYLKIVGPMKTEMGMNPCAYQPDDRTIVFDEEAAIQKLIRRRKSVAPAYLAGSDWDRVSRGLLAVAIANEDAFFVKLLDLGRPDEAVVSTLFKGVDRWIFGVDDTDTIMLHAAAACRVGAGETVARAVESLVKTTQRDGMTGSQKPDSTALDFEHRNSVMLKSLLTNLRVGHDVRSVDIRAEGLGTLAEFASFIEDGLKEGAIQIFD